MAQPAPESTLMPPLVPAPVGTRKWIIQQVRRQRPAGKSSFGRDDSFGRHSYWIDRIQSCPNTWPDRLPTPAALRVVTNDDNEYKMRLELTLNPVKVGVTERLVVVNRAYYNAGGEWHKEGPCELGIYDFKVTPPSYRRVGVYELDAGYVRTDGVSPLNNLLDDIQRQLAILGKQAAPTVIVDQHVIPPCAVTATNDLPGLILERLRARLPDKVDVEMRSIYDHWIGLFESCNWPPTVDMPVPSHMTIVRDQSTLCAELSLFYGEARRVSLCFKVFNKDGKWADCGCPNLYAHNLEKNTRAMVMNYMLFTPRMVEYEMRQLRIAIAAELDKVEPKPAMPTLSDWILERLNRYMPSKTDRSMRAVYDHWTEHFGFWQWWADPICAPAHMNVLLTSGECRSELTLWYGDPRRVAVCYKAKCIDGKWSTQNVPTLRVYDFKKNTRRTIGKYNFEDTTVMDGELVRLRTDIAAALANLAAGAAIDDLVPAADKGEISAAVHLTMLMVQGLIEYDHRRGTGAPNKSQWYANYSRLLELVDMGLPMPDRLLVREYAGLDVEYDTAAGNRYLLLYSPAREQCVIQNVNTDDWRCVTIAQNVGGMCINETAPYNLPSQMAALQAKLNSLV